ncbi:MAG: DUF6165 family protein [Candidatus Pelagibacterales bacterium]|jgi:hypothetical protein|tara:strand:- start:147 stop:533 length:387 start_codon:yes stop_codon:yes gene_type:complete
MLINIPVSVGELVDKITILEIKKIKIKDKNKLLNVNREYKYLKEILRKKIKISLKIKNEILALKKINLKLWNIEDKKRKAEKNKKFDSAFIKYARNVYIYNDIRAKIKHNINVLAGSKIIEEKSYSRY